MTDGNQSANGPNRRDVLKKIGATGIAATGATAVGVEAVDARGSRAISASVTNVESSDVSDDELDFKNVKFKPTGRSGDQVVGTVFGTVKREGGRAYSFRVPNQTAEVRQGGASLTGFASAGGGAERQSVQQTGALAQDTECKEATEIVGLFIPSVSLNVLGLIVDLETVDLEVCCDPERGLLGQILCGILFP